MINGKSVLAVIPARGGSKGVPRKNIRSVGGQPLIAWTIEAALRSSIIDRLILSTDDDEIAKVAKEYGCEVPFMRPPELALDHTPGIDPVLHAVEQLPGYDYVVLLQPTSPLRQVEDIDGCVSLCVQQASPAAVSVTECDKSPFWMYQLDERHSMKPILEVADSYTRRQELPAIYALNGAVYVAEVRWLQERKTFLTEETIAYVMPKNRSIDLDTELDFEILEYLISKR